MTWVAEKHRGELWVYRIVEDTVCNVCEKCLVAGSQNPHGKRHAPHPSMSRTFSHGATGQTKKPSRLRRATGLSPSGKRPSIRHEYPVLGAVKGLFTCPSSTFFGGPTSRCSGT